MNKNQFLHLNEEYYFKGTLVCSNLPSPQKLIELISLENKKIKINVGWSKLNPKDQYVKEVGRQVSSKRLQEYELLLKEVYFNDTFLDFYFVNTNEKELINSITLSTRIGRNSTHFIDAGFSEV